MTSHITHACHVVLALFCKSKSWCCAVV